MEKTLANQPMAADGRILLIDSIRALALLGVIVMNVSAMQMLFVGRELMANAGAVDIGAMLFDLLIFQGKARSCFAFLFGFGFAMMMVRAEAKGADFVPVYVRRMLGLLAFGTINQAFLWWGDILVLYALLGLLLMLFRNRSDAALLKAGLLLILAPPILLGLAEMVAGGPLPGIIAGDATAGGLAAMTSGNYADFVRFAIPLAIERRLTDTPHMIIYDLTIFGLFLLGAWAARRGIATDVDRHRVLLRRVMLLCLPLGFLLSAVSASRLAGFKAEGLLHSLVTTAAIGLPIMAIGYLAAGVLLFSKRMSAFQRLIAPAGRMPLTNYLASGAIGCWIFYGFGLGMLGKIGLAATNLLALGIFVGLLVFSHLWLMRFRLGPIEWVWRVMTYGRTARLFKLAEVPG
jgi:uncharacterized protein